MATASDDLHFTLQSLFPGASAEMLSQAAQCLDINTAIDLMMAQAPPTGTSPQSGYDAGPAPAPPQLKRGISDGDRDAAALILHEHAEASGNLPTEDTLPAIGSKPFNELRLEPVGAIMNVPANGYAVLLAKSTPVAELLEALCEKLGVPCTSASLSYAGRDLDLEQTVKENGIIEPGPAARRAGSKISVSFALHHEASLAAKANLSDNAAEAARKRAHAHLAEVAAAKAEVARVEAAIAKAAADELEAAREAARQALTAKDSSKAVDVRPGVRRTRDGWEITCRVNRSMPTQSLRSLTPEQNPAEIVMQHVGDDNTAAFAAVCFEQMLQREQELEADFCVFYHSYNAAALLYEVQAEIARCAYGLADNFAPLPRIQSRHFRGKDASLKELRKVGSVTGQDHNPKFRSLAISATPTLFSFGSEAPPLSCFRMGYGCGDLSFRCLLTQVLMDAVALKGKAVEELVDQLAEAGHRYGLQAHGYASTGGACSHRLSTAVAREGLGGHMLQIFIARSEVEEFVYHSYPMGLPVESTKSVKAWLAGKEGKVDGQVRIMLNPEIFINPERGQIFHYCGDWQFLGGSPDMEGSRAGFVVEIRKILAGVLRQEDAANIRKRLSGSSR